MVRTPHPSENHKNIGFLRNSGLDPLKNHKAAKPAIKVGPSSARQQMAFRRRDDDGPIIVVWYLDPTSPHQLKNLSKSDKT